ncbi:uncharacterized protein LOC131647219 [Vicia villosa]|uniref:uncharacterized protein LOC131647219 n=1 Tax=Vicia villosa TaxID=3911 RepID=UPI00273BEB13|nr:uncharacterized protein LOC131647219 [Vicia villosa]
MSNLKHQFKILSIIGENFKTWNNNLIEYLSCEGLNKILEGDNSGKTTDDPEEMEKKKSKVNRIIKHHLDDGLQTEYSNAKDPKILWDKIKARFGHQKKVLLPSLMDQWNKLQFQDYKTVIAYNSAMHQIIAKLEFCGKTITEKEKLEKTFSTFHASQVLLQQQYRMREYTEYSDLVAALLVAEQNNELLIKNHQARPTGTMPYPGINATTFNRGCGGFNLLKRRGGHVRSDGNNGHARFDGQYQGGYHGRNLFHGRNYFRGRGRGRGHMNNYRSPIYDQNNWNRKGKGKYIQEGPSRNYEDICYRCGKKGRWSKMCRTPEHLCKRPMAYAEEKRKEVNFNEIEPRNNNTYFETADFVGGETD